MIARFLILFFCCFANTACEQILLKPDPPNDPKANFDLLWNTFDERYSFFAYKNIDWGSVYNTYAPQVQTNTTEQELWRICTTMLDELHDGHVNLRNEQDVYFYPWYAGAPKNFDRFLLEQYYWGDFEITGSLVNTIIDSVGYLYYGSFDGTITEANLDYLAAKFEGLRGIIIDLRDNQGGNPDNGFRLARRIADQERHIYTTIYKDGINHNDFTAPDEAYLGPQGIPFPSRIAVLCNRTTYSAANFFVAMSKAYPNMTIVGDTTGGGGGAPVGWELPNGWSFNFSSSITYLPDGFIIEHGVPPDITVDMDDANRLDGIDDILERALTLFP